ncbi:hypothetical protein NKJ46_29810 [Mesorhizobium sp. M0166]|uniref:hypothetical protein n=1 Tax=Mesorhizobium sp. M0166 TaxID=2956902 RepID=UPI0033399A77
MASEFSSYDIIDPFLMSWANRHGIRVATKYRDDDVRSIWVYDKNGNRRAQLWLDLPDANGNVTIVASVLDPKSATERNATHLPKCCKPPLKNYGQWFLAGPGKVHIPSSYLGRCLISGNKPGICLAPDSLPANPGPDCVSNQVVGSPGVEAVGVLFPASLPVAVVMDR